ncbi:MAG: alpha-galactosidase, partial [bacterium]|nr:alpha-galactosidase [Candidatus Colisoma equi]
AKRRGLGFGLWVEPEMANVKSELAEAHPDWILREEKRPLAVGRGGTQVVLDYTNPAGRRGVWEMLDGVFGESAPLAYVKWDSNQNIVNPGSAYLAADRQPNLWYDYTIGLYDVLAKCRARRPDTLIQACASGGGHVDFGILRYCDEFWTSDCTDPLCRVFIQWGTSMFYPANAMAAHVTASPNHQTGRRTPLKYRFDVAMTGRMGFELHPKDLSADELAFAKRAVADYKRIRPIVQQGDLYRLASPYENDFAALMYVNGDRSRAVVFVLGLDRAKPVSVSIPLMGLDAADRYEVREINCGVSRHSANVDAGRMSISLNWPFDSAVFQMDRHGYDR